MRKSIISAVLLIIFCISCAISVSAESGASHFVVDEYGVLTAEEQNALHLLAQNIYEDSGVGVFFVYTQAEQFTDYNFTSLLNGIEDYVIMMENDTSWGVLSDGKGAVIDEEAADILRAAYDTGETYGDGVEAYLYAAADFLSTMSGISDAAMSDAGEYLVFDEACLLTESEEAALAGKLMEISHTYNAQIVVATIEALEDVDIDEFVDYIYDSMGFGYGEAHDGVLLLVCMNPRQYRILSNGFPGEAIDSGDIDSIGDAIAPSLSAGNYAAAFDEFANQCSYYLDGYINGFPFDFSQNITVCLILGIVVGLVVAFGLKKQLKTVRKKEQAHDYVKPESMQISVSNDIFLYRSVSRSKKASSSSSSSSGSSRSSGGGSF